MTAPAVGRAWPGGRALVTDESAFDLNLSAAVGQQVSSYRFDLINGVTGQRLGTIKPIRTGTLTMDTSRTTKRDLSLALGKADTAAINVLTDRIVPYMVIPGYAADAFPLGRYQFTDPSRQPSTGGRTSNVQLSDEMFLVDQQISQGIAGAGRDLMLVILDVVAGLGLTLDIEPSPYVSADAWTLGATRGQILDAIAVAGDWLSPWFDNRGTLRFRRTFNPADVVPTLDLDSGYQVIRSSIIETDNVLTAPNRFIVIGNSNSDPTVVGIADVSPNAPNSIARRGFAIPDIRSLQLTDATQAAAVARGLAQRNTIFEMVELTTPADPRHDGYDVVRWQGENWLELGWSMPLLPGAPMRHRMRKAYS